VPNALLAPVPPESQSVTFGKNGYLTQTAQISVREPAKRSFFARNPPPTLVPNPVEVTLQPAVPPAMLPASDNTQD
jgi:hypothetical protein